MINPKTQEAYDLMHQGTLVFARMEQNGVCIDTEYCRKVNSKLEREMAILFEELEATKEARVWKKHYGNKTKYSSNDQLADIFYNRLGYEPTKYTVTGKYSTDEESIAQIDSPFIEKLLRLRHLSKAKSTYMDNIIRETINGYMYPFVSLNLVSTYRSSSSKPNFQNIPIRDPEIGKLIRTAFIPRKNRYLVETDFKAIEVSVAACYNKDPKLVKYIEGQGDMHTDMAKQCYKLNNEELGNVSEKPGKNIRYCAKNKFVFPEFYGSYYEQTAKSLWEAITEMKLKNSTGIGLRKHLKNKDIHNYSMFLEHIKEVEEDFWGRRFKVYAKWKDDFYKEYLRKGYFHTLTGFTCQGFMKKNEVVNYPIQGSAFHVNLRSIIEIQRILDKKRMETKLVGQIHDSLIADVPEAEFEMYIRIVKKVTTQFIPRVYKWINVPINIEIEASELNGNWYEKREVA